LKDSSRETIAIRPANGKKPCKITEIAGLEGNGFSILVPCHKAHTGFLFKHPVIPGVAAPRFVAWDAAVAFDARDKAKLNYHADGFVEFSGERPGRITASKDLVSGEAKGLGLFSRPLSRPSFGGPILALTVYGLDQFESAQEKDGLIVFEPCDFYYRNCTPKSANAWTLAIYAFPKGIVPPVRFVQKRPMIRASVEQLNGPMSSVVDLVAVSLLKEELFIGLFVSRIHIPIQRTSGWLLSGPGDWAADRRGHVLMGIYPRTEILSPQKSPGAPSTDTAQLSPSARARRTSPHRKMSRQPREI